MNIGLAFTSTCASQCVKKTVRDNEKIQKTFHQDNIDRFIGLTYVGVLWVIASEAVFKKCDYLKDMSETFYQCRKTTSLSYLTQSCSILETVHNLENILNVGADEVHNI